MECFRKEPRKPSRIELVDLRKAVRDALSGVREEARKQEGGVKIKTYLRSVSPVQGDPDEIRRMLSHVVANAVDAMPGGGYLYLSTEENAGYAHVYVQDSRGGIPPQICEGPPEPFVEAEGTEKSCPKLGLCRAMVRRHGGEMEISSGKNQGTMVTLRLPLAKGERQEAKKPPRKKGIKHARVLIIEEASIIGELLMQMFKSKGCRAEIAATATEGIALLQKKNLDLVMVGADIAGMKGEALARRIKKIKPPLPVVLIASGSRRKRGDSGRPPFVDLVITKPIDMSRTLERIAELLSRAK